jgi:hypothetical protein
LHNFSKNGFSLTNKNHVETIRAHNQFAAVVEERRRRDATAMGLVESEADHACLHRSTWV